MIHIVDYAAGNLASVERALKKLKIPCRVSPDPEEILKAERVIFPGVGAAGEAMKVLQFRGLDQALKRFVASGRPLLGICLGTQIILDYSSENDTPCLGILPGEVRRFPQGHKDREGRPLKIPHMGWNRVRWLRDHPLIRSLPPDCEYYFVHAYYPVPAEEQKVLGITEYGFPFPSALAFRNVVALQFHPEKSGPPGLALLKAFAEWEGQDVD